jgi:hypothetical protein
MSSYGTIMEFLSLRNSTLKILYAIIFNVILIIGLPPLLGFLQHVINYDFPLSLRLYQAQVINFFSAMYLNGLVSLSIFIAIITLFYVSIQLCVYEWNEAHQRALEREEKGLKGWEELNDFMWRLEEAEKKEKLSKDKFE